MEFTGKNQAFVCTILKQACVLYSSSRLTFTTTGDLPAVAT